MCVNNLSKVALDSAAAGIEPAISSRKSNALTTTPLSHTMGEGDFRPSTARRTLDLTPKRHYLGGNDV